MRPRTFATVRPLALRACSASTGTPSLCSAQTARRARRTGRIAG
nr:hypothetical protein RVX_0632 [Nitratidesulfovibrio sp. HK-II]